MSFYHFTIGCSLFPTIEIVDVAFFGNLGPIYMNLGAVQFTFFTLDDIPIVHSEQTTTLGFIEEWWTNRGILDRT